MKGRVGKKECEREKNFRERCWIERRKIIEEPRERETRRGRKWGRKKRPSEQERERGREVRFSFVVVGE